MAPVPNPQNLDTKQKGNSKRNRRKNQAAIKTNKTKSTNNNKDAKESKSENPVGLMATFPIKRDLEESNGAPETVNLQQIQNQDQDNDKEVIQDEDLNVLSELQQDLLKVKLQQILESTTHLGDIVFVKVYIKPIKEEENGLSYICLTEANSNSSENTETKVSIGDNNVVDIPIYQRQHTTTGNQKHFQSVFGSLQVTEIFLYYRIQVYTELIKFYKSLLSLTRQAFERLKCIREFWQELHLSERFINKTSRFRFSTLKNSAASPPEENIKKENMVHEIGGQTALSQEGIVNSVSLEDVPLSESHDLRAQSIQSLHSVIDTPTPDTAPTYDELQHRLDEYNRHIEHMNEQKNQLLRMHNDAKRHLLLLEQYQQQCGNNTLSFDGAQNGAGSGGGGGEPPNYESVQEVENDMSILAGRVNKMTELVNSQRNLVGQLNGADADELRADQEQLEEKLRGIRKNGDDIRGITTELDTLNNKATTRPAVEQKDKLEKESSPTTSDRSDTPTGIKLEESTSSDTVRVVPIRVGGNSEAATGRSIEQKEAEIETMKAQLQRLKNMMSTIESIETNASKAINNDKQRKISSMAMADAIKVENDASDDYDHERTPTMSRADVQRNLRKLQGVSSDVRAEGERMLVEKERIRALQDEISRCSQQAAAAAQLGEDALKRNSLTPTPTPTSKGILCPKAGDELELEYEAKKQDYWELCRRLDEMSANEPKSFNRQHSLKQTAGSFEPITNDANNCNNSATAEAASNIGGITHSLPPINMPGNGNSASTPNSWSYPNFRCTLPNSVLSGLAPAAFLPSPMLPGPPPNNDQQIYFNNVQHNPPTTTSNVPEPPATANAAQPNVAQPVPSGSGQQPAGSVNIPQPLAAVNIPQPLAGPNIPQPLAGVNIPQPIVSLDQQTLQNVTSQQQGIVQALNQFNNMLWQQQRDIDHLNRIVQMLNDRIIRLGGEPIIQPTNFGIGVRAESVPPAPMNMFASGVNRAQSEQPMSYSVDNSSSSGSGSSANIQVRYILPPHLQQQLEQYQLQQQLQQQQVIHQQHQQQQHQYIPNIVAGASSNLFTATQHQQQQSSSSSSSNNASTATFSALNNASVTSRTQSAVAGNEPAPIFMHHHNNPIHQNNANLRRANVHANGSSSSSSSGTSANISTLASILDSQNTLNNQVPPGIRANNYWDNFRSLSRQNVLSANTYKSNEGNQQQQPQQQQPQQQQQQPQQQEQEQHFFQQLLQQFLPTQLRQQVQHLVGPAAAERVEHPQDSPSLQSESTQSSMPPCNQQQRELNDLNQPNATSNIESSGGAGAAGGSGSGGDSSSASGNASSSGSGSGSGGNGSNTGQIRVKNFQPNNQQLNQQQPQQLNPLPVGSVISNPLHTTNIVNPGELIHSFERDIRDVYWRMVAPPLQFPLNIDQYTAEMYGCNYDQQPSGSGSNVNNERNINYGNSPRNRQGYDKVATKFQYPVQPPRVRAIEQSNQQQQEQQQQQQQEQDQEPEQQQEQQQKLKSPKQEPQDEQESEQQQDPQQQQPEQQEQDPQQQQQEESQQPQIAEIVEMGQQAELEVQPQQEQQQQRGQQQQQQPTDVIERDLPEYIVNSVSVTADEVSSLPSFYVKDEYLEPVTTHSRCSHFTKLMKNAKRNVLRDTFMQITGIEKLPTTDSSDSSSTNSFWKELQDENEIKKQQQKDRRKQQKQLEEEQQPKPKSKSQTEQPYQQKQCMEFLKKGLVTTSNHFYKGIQNKLSGYVRPGKTPTKDELATSPPIHVSISEDNFLLKQSTHQDAITPSPPEFLRTRSTEDLQNIDALEPEDPVRLQQIAEHKKRMFVKKRLVQEERRLQREKELHNEEVRRRRYPQNHGQISSDTPETEIQPAAHVETTAEVHQGELDTAATVSVSVDDQNMGACSLEAQQHFKDKDKEDTESNSDKTQESCSVEGFLPTVKSNESNEEGSMVQGSVVSSTSTIAEEPNPFGSDRWGKPEFRSPMDSRGRTLINTIIGTLRTDMRNIVFIDENTLAVVINVSSAIALDTLRHREYPQGDACLLLLSRAKLRLSISQNVDIFPMRLMPFLEWYENFLRSLVKESASEEAWRDAFCRNDFRDLLRAKEIDEYIQQRTGGAPLNQFQERAISLDATTKLYSREGPHFQLAPQPPPQQQPQQQPPQQPPQQQQPQPPTVRITTADGNVIYPDTTKKCEDKKKIKDKKKCKDKKKKIDEKANDEPSSNSENSKKSKSQRNKSGKRKK